MLKIKNYIGGRFREPVSGSYLDDIEPATGRVHALAPDSDERDVELAVQAAAQAFPSWSATPAAERSQILLKLADLLEKNLEPLARAESADGGKPIRLARSLDIPRAASNLRFFATAVLHFQSESHLTERSAESRAINYTLRQPRGVAGLISPWNFPLYLLTWKVAPALASGNTAVAKPSELTPLTAHLLCELADDAGLPPGVLNVVHGLGPKAGAALVRHPQVPTISFTGGTETGAEIARAAAPLFKKLALELGGKNPNIVFADANLDAALPSSLRAAFIHQGQMCLCGSRVFVEKGAYPAFVKRLVSSARKLKVGDPRDPSTDQGALISREHLEKVSSYVELARKEGGSVLCGGSRPSSLPSRVKGGYFLEPTVVAGLPVDSRVNQEEIFGPVVTVTPFTDEEEVVRYANSTRYGLSASVWTQNLARAHRLTERISSGTVWVNCWLLRDLRVPFGGTKQSGVGREGGEEALRFFTEPKNVCIQFGSQTPPGNRRPQKKP